MKVHKLPNVLTPLDIMSFLGVSKSSAYELVKSNNFHVVKVGRKFLIPKQAFVSWFEGARVVQENNNG